jgi:hypothetical protein
MTPIPAVVQVVIDVEILAERILAAINEERTLDVQLGNLQERLAHKRVAIGKLLREARPAWPERGPRAKGWGDYLTRLGISEVTAWRYMELAGAVVSFSEKETPDQPPDVPSYAELGIDKRAREPAPDSATSELAAPAAEPPPQVANVNGGSKDPRRGTYCTPEPIAKAVGEWDLDPFTNPRSHVVAAEMCMLERGDDGLLDLDQPGSYYIEGDGQGQATADTRVWIQPPYEIVLEAIGHYGHTRFCALLRFDPSTEWFELLLAHTAVICVPFERIEFDAPPGIETSANPYPHALYYACEDDITDEVRRMCLVLRVERRGVDLRHTEEGAIA